MLWQVSQIFQLINERISITTSRSTATRLAARDPRVSLGNIMELIRQSETTFLGAYASDIYAKAKWAQEDEFPSNQQWADDLEKILKFAAAQRQLNKFTPKLTASASQRDSALAELRVAFHLHSQGLNISSWEPVGLPPKEGEFKVVDKTGREVFVEVKSPGWEGELSKDEINNGRARKPKYIQAEARSIAPWERIQFAVNKAYDKFLASIPNLLVIADDLFVGLDYRTDHMVKIALYSTHNNGPFTSKSYERLGGVGIFWIDTKSMKYVMNLYINPFALSNCTIPNEMRLLLKGVELDIDS